MTTGQLDYQRKQRPDVVRGDMAAAADATCPHCQHKGLRYVLLTPETNPYMVYGPGYRCPECKRSEPI